MSKAKKTVTPRRAGRSPIQDDLELYVFVEMERRRRGVSTRELTTDRKFLFEGKLNFPILANYFPRQGIRGDTLRRRFGKARRELDLGKFLTGITSTAHDEYQRESTLILERLMADLAN